MHNLKYTANVIFIYRDDQHNQNEQNDESKDKKDSAKSDKPESNAQSEDPKEDSSSKKAGSNSQNQDAEDEHPNQEGGTSEDLNKKSSDSGSKTKEEIQVDFAQDIEKENKEINMDECYKIVIKIHTKCLECWDNEDKAGTLLMELHKIYTSKKQANGYLRSDFIQSLPNNRIRAINQLIDRLDIAKLKSSIQVQSEDLGGDNSKNKIEENKTANSANQNESNTTKLNDETANFIVDALGELIEIDKSSEKPSNLGK